MLSVHCPTCDTVLALPDEMLGQQVRCGDCQGVFVAEAPPKRARARDDEDRDRDRDRDRPSSRRRERDDEDDDDRDRPSRRRRRDRDEDDDYDDRPARPKKKRRKKKAVAGMPGLAMAAAILFLIWGGIGAIWSIYSIVGLVTLLDVGAPASFVLSYLVSTILSGCFAAFLVVSGLKVLNGQVEDIASVGTAALAVCGAMMIWSVVQVAMIAPVFALSFALRAFVTALVFMSGIIVGGIFCIVCSQKYEKWQSSS